METIFTNLLRERDMLISEFEVLRKRLKKELSDLHQYNIKAIEFNKTVSKKIAQNNFVLTIN